VTTIFTVFPIATPMAGSANARRQGSMLQLPAIPNWPSTKLFTTMTMMG
jgi:hypothetical protein